MKSSSTIFSSSSFFFFLFGTGSIFVSWSTLLLLSHPVVVVVAEFSLNSEGEALLSLLNRFSYFDEFSTKLNWNLSGSSTPCQWSGVGCNIEKTHVVSLELYDYGICGQLGPQIGQLRYLKSLDLSFNHFNGSIPTQLWNCSRLQHLDLSFNNFTGELPDDAVWNLQRLNYFDISINHFSGRIPADSFFHNSYLKYVDLSGNNVTGSIPLNIGNATNMKLLRLTGNSFYGNIPTSIANCTKLEVLYMDRNGLSGNIPLGLWRIPTLAYLDTYNNNLSGELPVEMTELHHLIYISLQGNRFSGMIPKALGINSTGLKYVHLSNNSFTGEIPPNLCFGKQLKVMNLAQNQFHGSIPSSYIGNYCYSLNKVILQGNKLTGSLPHFGRNLSLTALDISRNSIHGQIPLSICNLTSLVFLDLSENQMNGKLLHCLGDLSRLITLNLRNNNFSGIISMNFTGDQWHTIDLNGNHFEGKIPRSLGTHTPYLTYLDLGNNQLNDTFPVFFEMLSRLEILVLRSNKLHGPLRRPHTRLAFNKLKILDISSNYFTGDLPLQFLSGLDGMKHVNPFQVLYTDNQNIDHIYYLDTRTIVIHKGKEMQLNITLMNTFRAIDFSNNKFQGAIPASVGELATLMMFNMSGNNFNGCIPSSLGSLNKLESLDLSNNKLSGGIPLQLTSLHSLSVLNLSQNQLTGQIPVGGQFLTFKNDSFSGNSGLCGVQVSRECGDNTNPKPTGEEERNHQDSNNPWSFGWEPVVIGYGCGIVIGLVIQYFVFTKASMYRWFG